MSVEVVPAAVTGSVGPVAGVVDPAAVNWSVPPLSLAPLTGYALEVRAENADGVVATARTSFTTGEPALVQTPAVSPLTGSTVGTGHPVVVTFDHLVRDRDAVEAAMRVTTSQDVGPAAWYWLTDKQAVYRPQTYWPAGTHVDVVLDLDRVRTGDEGWVMEDRTISFDVGRSRVIRIDDATHQMEVVDAGQVVRTVPVSMGKPGYITRSGTKVLMTLERTHRMTSESAGITEESYDVVVDYALRLTNTGEFIHAAPWSVRSQGNSNVSHGCVNVSEAEGQWLFETSLVGDPVETVGTGRAMEPGNGLGGVWNVPWETWTA